MDFYVAMDVSCAVCNDLNFIIIAIFIIFFEMESNYISNSQIFTNSTINTARQNDDGEFVAQVDINNGLRMVQTKKSIIPNGAAHVNHLNDNGLHFGNDPRTLTNYHGPMYDELLFTVLVEINKIIHWNTATVMSEPLLNDTMIIKGITNP